MPISSRYPAIVQRAARAASRAFIPRGPFPSINAVQWAVESAYGGAMSGRNNCFGIKATPTEIAAGKATKRLTHETIDGVYKPYWLWFADFDSVEDCFRAHAALLTNEKMGWAYKDCWTAQTPEAYAHALSEHYATGEPGHDYGQTLIDWMRRDGLAALDAPEAPEPAPKPVPASEPAPTPHAPNVAAAATGAASVVVATAAAAPHVAGVGLPAWILVVAAAAILGGVALVALAFSRAGKAQA